MRFHFIGDRTERLFSRGQKLLDQWLFEEAIESFDRAIETDRSYAHLHLYKGLALAESGRYNEAVVEVQNGAQLEVNNFVFPMYLGCLHLDEGHLDDAQTAFDNALSLAGTNPLVTSYRILTAFLKGERSLLAQLFSTLSTLPDSFKSRLLVAIGPHEPDIRPPGSKPTSEIDPNTIFGRVRSQFRRWRLSLVEWRVRRLMGARNYRRALHLLRGESAGSSTLLSLEQETKTRLEKELTAQLNGVENGSARSRRKRTKRVKRDRRSGEQQRRALLELADLYEADDPKRYRCLERWMESFRAAQTPNRLKHLASEVLTEMADLARDKGRLDMAFSLCKESRAVGSSAEVDWIEGLVSLANGNRRLARRLFERFARNKPLAFAHRAANALEYRASREGAQSPN